VSALTFEFEGQQRTVTEIQALVPAISRAAIVAHIKAGRTTRHQMLNFDPRAAMRAGGRRGRIAVGPRLTFAKGMIR
jgi:hypothetical protein